MTQLEAMKNAQLFHYACRVPIALYRGFQCFAALPETRQTASFLLNNGDPLRALDVQMQQLYIPQHVKSSWREHFIFLNAGDDLMLLAGPVTTGEMDDTRMRRLFRMLGPMVSREGSLRKYLSSLPVVSGETCYYLGRMLMKLFIKPRETDLANGQEEPLPDAPALPAEDLPSDLSSVVRGALSFIDHHLTDKLTAQMIADHVQVHRDYLSARFKKETGIAMMVYIQKRRVEEACHFLRFSRYSLQEIASLCQFSSQSRFTEIFKRHIGMTPNQYREEA